MTYIVKDECIKCKLTDCVEVCPVDCFYEGENFLTINPNKTIQLGKKYTEIFPDFASGTTLDLARLLQRWDKKDIVGKFLKLKI